MPTIENGSKHMQAVLYTGTGATQTISGLNFQPDLIWIKSRSAATDNKLTDSVRGVTKSLESNTTDAEATDTNGVTAITSTGFTLGSDSVYNNSGATYVAWCWKGGEGSTSSNTSGSITSTVSVNASAGFSVVTCTSPSSAGAFTFGHGLGTAPKFIISKSRSGTGNWSNYHVSTGAGGYLLFTTAAYTANTDTWNNTTPTSTVVSSTTNWWGTSSDLVFYCWSEIEGFSKFGSYTGNGSTDGAFVYTGFRPKFIMIKCSSGVTNWRILDTSRDVYNVEQYEIYPNLSNAEATFSSLDGLSNGFKLRNTDAAYNGSGSTYIYAAFAENPFKNALAR